jgi:hypothetical protein
VPTPAGRSTNFTTPSAGVFARRSTANFGARKTTSTPSTALPPILSVVRTSSVAPTSAISSMSSPGRTPSFRAGAKPSASAVKR